MNRLNHLISLGILAVPICFWGCTQENAEEYVNRPLLIEVNPESEIGEGKSLNQDSDGESSTLPSESEISCHHFCEPRKIRVEEPTKFGTYDGDTLGLVMLCGSSASRACVDRALSDGAILLEQRADRQVLLYPTRFEAFIDEARMRIDMPAMEGRWSESMNRVVPGVNGRRIDFEQTLQNLKDAVKEDRDFFAVAIDTIPALSSDISEFSDFQPTVLIGTFQTKFSRARNRTHNVKLASSAVDGLFLMPGASFSYNDWVGERSEARGFKEAPVIEQGQMVEGLGGGACQVSSTIHAAALLSGLAILERYNHSLPSSYIPKGLDAVVSYPILDLRIRNSYERPVVLRVRIEDNRLISEFYSDVPRHSKIYVRSEAVAEIPYKEIVTTNPNLEPGTLKITKRGKVGYRMQRSRIILKDGKEIFEKLLDDTYQSQVQRVTISPDVIYPPPKNPEEATGIEKAPSGA